MSEIKTQKNNRLSQLVHNVGWTIGATSVVFGEISNKLNNLIPVAKLILATPLLTRVNSNGTTFDRSLFIETQSILGGLRHLGLDEYIVDASGGTVQAIVTRKDGTTTSFTVNSINGFSSAINSFLGVS